MPANLPRTRFSAAGCGCGACCAQAASKNPNAATTGKARRERPNPEGREATLENKITAIGIHAIVARVYYTPSWIDQRECIVLDYSKTSLLARKIRDEIRLVDPVAKLYLGKVWWGKTRLVDFALKFPN